MSACDSAVMTEQSNRHGGCLFRFIHAVEYFQHTPYVWNNAVPTNLANWRLPMPRYFFDIKNGHRLVDPSGSNFDNDTDAIDRAKVIAIGVSLDKPAVDPERHIAVIDDAGQEVSRVPVYSRPSAEHPAK
jgi:hypothetical protein